MAVLYTPHFVQFFDDDGAPLSGGKLYTYSAGTVTPKDTYTTAAGSIANANPVILDASGRATVFLNGSYKFRLEDSLGNLIEETDNITAFSVQSSTVDDITANFTEEVIQAADSIIFSDESDSGATKRDTVQGVLDLAYAAFKGKILNGLTLSNNTTDATNDIDIAAGSAVSDDGTTIMTLSSSYTKQLDAAWAVGSGAGGLDTGSIANGTYHVWLINRPDTGVTDVLFSTSATSPTMPTNYTKKKRIGSIMRESGVIAQFEQIGNRFRRVTRSADINLTTLSTSATTLTLSIPSGVNVLVECSVYLETSGTQNFVYFRSLGAKTETDIAPDEATHDISVGGANPGSNNTTFMRRSNTSSQIGYRASSANIGNLRVWTLGWVDEAL